MEPLCPNFYVLDHGALGLVAQRTKGAFFYSQFWNENGQNVKYARFSILHSYSGMDRTPFHPFCSLGQNEQNVANENPRWRTAR